MQKSWSRKTAMLSVAAWLIAAATTARAGYDDEEIEKACPAAVTEKVQLTNHQAPPKPVDHVTRPALQKLLLQMVADDQAARVAEIEATKSRGGDLREDDPAHLKTLRVDNDNLPRLKHIISQDGFPTSEMVGPDGVHAAFLLTQHADEDLTLQARVLKLLLPRLHSHEIDGEDYALLTDRVLVSQGKPQRYGTQFEPDGEGLKPSLIGDAAHVDARRRAMGLVSIKNYTCILQVMYGRH